MKYILSIWLLLCMAAPVMGQTSLVETDELLAIEATEAAEATESAEEATPAARLEPKSDVTQPTGEVKGRLESYLDEQVLGPVNPTNIVKYAIRWAVREGVPPNTIVLVLLFPVVAAVVATARHMIGLRGFGIYIPAVLSVGFVAMGLFSGLLLFLIILAVGTYGMKLLRKLKMQYLPRVSLLLWLVSVGVLATLLVSPLLGLSELATVNIFPILILMLLAENFNEVQMGKSQREATELTIETLILAALSALILSLDLVQRFALLHPETLIIGVAVVNIMVGKYVGLRLTEFLKFRHLTQSE